MDAAITILGRTFGHNCIQITTIGNEREKFSCTIASNQ